MDARRRCFRGQARALAVPAALALVLTLLLAPAPALADTTVTTCTQTGVQDALNAGGVITFNCGSVTTITVISQLEASADATVIGPIVLDGGNTTRVLHVPSGVTLTLEQVTISHGSASGDGGGVFNEGTLTVDESTFSGSTAGFDGGVVENDGTATVTNSTFSNNTASGDGGAIDNSGTLAIANSTFTGNVADIDGGAIHDDGTLTVTSSTFDSNTAKFDVGGAIDSDLGDTVTIANSTFSGNTAVTGGALDVDGTVTVTNSTFSANTAAGSGGAIDDSEATPTVTNSILVNNSPDECEVPAISGGHNIVDDFSCDFNAAGDQENIDPADVDLGPLQDNGGPTETLLPGDNSIAIDAGDAAVCQASPVNGVDQRGLLRPAGPRCDVGAVEVGGIDLSTASAHVRGIAVLRRSCGSQSATGACLEWLVGVDLAGTRLEGVAVTVAIAGPDGVSATETATTGRSGAATFSTPVDAYGTYTLSVTGASYRGTDLPLSGATTRSIAIGGRFRR